MANSGYVTHLSADAANQGEVVNYRERAEARYTLKRNGVLINQGVLPVISSQPILLPGVRRGNYDFTLNHPGISIGGSLIPVVTKSSFTVDPAKDSNPPALRKLQLVIGGRLTPTIDPQATQNIVLFNIDPAPGTPSLNKLQAVTLAFSRVTADTVGNPRDVTVTRLPNGDWQAVLPQIKDAVRLDFKLVATNVEGNRLVSRFSLPVGAGRIPGPPPVIDEPTLAATPRSVEIL